MTATTAKTHFCILSDTHTVTPFPPNDRTHAYRYLFPASDVLIHCGDITTVGYLSEYETIFNFLKAAPAELKLVIAGNHDITLHKELYLERLKEKHGNVVEDVDRIREMWVGEEARRAGIVYLEEGVRRFELSNGASFTVYSSPWQPEYYDWAFTYPRHIDRFNPTAAESRQNPAENPVPAYPAIDIMITHGPPKDILDKTYFGSENVGCAHLRKAVERCKPRLHCFGHIHEGWGAEKLDWRTKKIEHVGQKQEKTFENKAAYINVSADSADPLEWGSQTLFVNASIMNVHSNPVNAPWVVDMELAVKSQ